MGHSLVSGAQRFSTTLCRSILSSPLRNNSAALRNCPYSFRHFNPSRLPSARGFTRSVAPAMASATSLPAAVESLSLQTTSETSKFPNCFPSLNPVDLYRQHIAESLGAAADIDAEKIYTRLQWTNTLDKGDLVLPVRDHQTSIFTSRDMANT